MFKSLRFIAWIQRLLKNDDVEDDTWSVIPISHFNKYWGLKFLLRSSNCDKKFPKDSDIPSFYKDILFSFLDLKSLYNSEDEQEMILFTAVISHMRPPTIYCHFENCILVDVNQMYP